MTEDATDRGPGLPLWLAPLAVMAVLAFFFWFRAAPLTLDPVRAENAETQFDTGRAIDRLARILGDETPHPVDSDALDITRGRLLAEIRALGYEPEVKDQTACFGPPSGVNKRCARVQNIIFSTGPATGPTLVLAAHYDSVDAAPGAGDDGIGVAVWLEVAHHLKQSPPDQPVMFLLTHGEEAALLGAKAFVDANAYGRTVSRFINLEARGVTGPAMMFETSHPNSGLVWDWSRNGARPFSNSMMTAVYELLPNSTDLTVWIGAGYSGVNIAISDGLSFYHTQRDDLAMLDHRSVQHMGDQALGAARAFLTPSADEGGEQIYADIASRVFVVMPQGIGLVLLGLCTALAALLMLSPIRGGSWRALDWRAFATPPAAIIIAAMLAWGASLLIGLFRAETAFWTAHPQWLNLVFFVCALVATAFGLAFLAPRSRREALFASGWFWFLGAGVALSIIVPGMAILFLIPGLVFVIAALVARFTPAPPLAAHIAAAILPLLIFYPLAHLLDVTMGLALAPVFGLVEALTLATLLALIGPILRGKPVIFGALGAGLAAFALGAILAPAYSRDQPLALNFVAHVDASTGATHLVASSAANAVPAELREALPETFSDIMPGVTVPVRGLQIDLSDSPDIDIFIDSDTTTDDVRKLALRVYAGDARMIRLRIPGDARPLRATLDGAPPTTTLEAAEVANPAGGMVFDCIGRECDGSLIRLELDVAEAAPDEPEPWIFQGFWTILPREAQHIAALRPDTTLPIQMGDITIATLRVPPSEIAVIEEVVDEETAVPL